MSTLLRAVDYGHTAFAQMLLDAGACIPGSEDERNRLSYAARSAGNPATLLLLLQRGLPPSRDDGDWAQERGHGEIQRLVEQAIGPFTIRYDIDELLTKPCNEFYFEFCSSVPAYSSIHAPLLYTQERVIQALWEFCCGTGSGFTALIGNERFDTVARAYDALREIRPSRCLRAVSELREVLHKHGFPLYPSESLDHLLTLPESAQQALEKEMEALDRRYFGGPDEDDLWRNGDYLDCGMEYAHQHVDVLRQRKMG
jgi:hypothetical protein